MARLISRFVGAAISMVLFHAATAHAGELRGRLLLGEKPAAGVTVLAVPYETAWEEMKREAKRGPEPTPFVSVKTLSDGSFVLRVPGEPGKEKLFTIRSEGGGARAASFDGVWEATETDDLGEHVLFRGEDLSGKVTDASGKAVADAEVVLLPSSDRGEEPDLVAEPRRATTAADGSFSFHDASESGNTLTVEKPGFLTAMRPGVKAGALGGAIVLGKGVTVSGVVVKGDKKSPASGAFVRIEARTATRWVETDERGAFSIAGAPPGGGTLVADAGDAGYVEQANLKLPVPPDTTLTLVLRPPSAIVGRTVDAKTGKPVPRARIEVRAGGRTRTARSGPDGSYSLRSLPPRTWQLRADEPRFVPWMRNLVPLLAGETKTLDIPLILGATISGRIADESGKPIAGAKGWLAQPNVSPLLRIAGRIRRAGAPAFRSLADGTFKAARLAPGANQLLTVLHPDFERGTLGGLSLPSGTIKSGVLVVLKRGAGITGLIKEASGKPIGGAIVDLSQPPNFSGLMRGGGIAGLIAGALEGPRGAENKTATTGAEGRFAIKGVAPGEYVLTIRRAGFATTQVDPVKVPDTGSPAPVDVTLAAGATISGRITRPSGEGAEGYVVTAGLPGRSRFGFGFGRGGAGAGGGAGGAGGSGRDNANDPPTGPDGSFRIEGLKPEQAYDLQIFGPAGPSDGKRGVVAPASDIVIVTAGTGRIKGTAREAQGGRPLNDFQVWYEPDRGGMRFGARGGGRNTGGGSSPGEPGQPLSVHDDSGAFTLEDVPAGTYSVIVSATGYQPARAGDVVVEDGATHDSVEVRLNKSTALKGRVRDAQSGAAVPNALVWLAPGGGGPGGAMMNVMISGEITTDAEGRFRIDGLDTGRQSLTVVHPDYADTSVTADVKEDGSEVDVLLSKGGVLAGAVASEAGQPVGGANVTLAEAGGGGFGGGFGFGGGGGGFGGGQSAVSDGAGGFRFDHLAAGRYTLSASSGSRVSEPLEVVLQAGQAQEAIALKLQGGATILGTVTGLPATMLTSMTVTANGSGGESYSQSTHVGADGSFEFDNVPIGVVMLRGVAMDSTGSSRSAVKQVTTAAEQPVLSTQLVFDQGFTLSGHVTQSGQAVAGANVFAIPQGGDGRQASAVTNGDGAYQLSGLQAGAYLVNATAAAAATSPFTGSGTSKSQSVSVSSDQTLDIVFPTAKIEGQVVDAGGHLPITNATVTIASRGTPSAGGGRPPQRPAATDSNGRFSFPGLDEGAYVVTTSKPDYLLDTHDVTASDPATGDVTIELTRSNGIGVKGQDGLAGAPLRGLVLRVLDPQGANAFGPAPVTLDSDGMGAVPALPPGTYTILAGASGYATVRLDNVAVPAPLVTISLTPGGGILLQTDPKILGSGALEGTITSATGQPAMLSVVNRDGRIAVSQPSTSLQHVPAGSYVLSIPSAEISKPFTVNEGATSVVAIP